MLSSAVRSFSDPDAYGAAVRAAKLELVADGNADFSAKLISVGLRRLWMQRSYAKAGGIARGSMLSGRAGILFALPPALTLNGVALPARRIVRYAPAQEFCLRVTAGSLSWAALGLPIEDLSAAGAALADQDLTPPRGGLIAEPKADAIARLARLHAAVGRLAEEDPELIANPSAAHGLEQALIEAAVDCLRDADVHENSSAQRRRELIMRRFFTVMEDNPHIPLYISEICVAIGVPHSALLLCCQEHLGMAPKRYLLLRRLRLARQELREGTPGKMSVAEIAGKYGFWEYGRFAGVYGFVFGERPSDTLRGVSH